MRYQLYWVSTVIYALVLISILLNDIRLKRRPNRVEKSYRMMVLWVIFFCLQDAIWGLCLNGDIQNDKVFFISSSVFHTSTVITTFFWLNYVLTYAGEKTSRKILALVVDGFVVALEIALVTMNFFTPALFIIRNGHYYTAYLRPLAFMNQYICYIMTGLVALIYYSRASGEKKQRYLTVVFFTLAPILTGAFQYLLPDGPYYSIGYFLGCFMIHLFVIAQEREEAEKDNVLKPMAETFFSMHIIDLETNTFSKYIEPQLLTDIFATADGAQDAANKVFTATIDDRFVNLCLEFVDFSTVSERMANTNRISMEFVSKYYGWMRVTFYSMEKQNGLQKKIMLVTQIVDDEKQKQIDLLYQSNTDELTKLNNRRAYENDINDTRMLKEDLVYISMDVNGLKVVNDTLGHEAGDELLKGAADCMKRCLGMYGKIYRTGGDEFCAMIYANAIQLKDIKRIFRETVEEWRGIYVDSLSVSCGYVTLAESKNGSINAMAILADQRMYEEKTRYYKEKGVDRRGQKDAHTALCAMYSKIARLNITDNTYSIVDSALDEEYDDKDYNKPLSYVLDEIYDEGMIHPDDLEEVRDKVDLNYLRIYFANGKTSMTLFYRRKIEGQYMKVMTEIIPAADYTDDNQILYLYIKEIS